MRGASTAQSGKEGRVAFEQARNDAQRRPNGTLEPEQSTPFRHVRVLRRFTPGRPVRWWPYVTGKALERATQHAKSGERECAEGDGSRKGPSGGNRVGHRVGSDSGHLVLAVTALPTMECSAIRGLVARLGFGGLGLHQNHQPDRCRRGRGARARFHASCHLCRQLARDTETCRWREEQRCGRALASARNAQKKAAEKSSCSPTVPEEVRPCGGCLSNVFPIVEGRLYLACQSAIFSSTVRANS